MPVRLSILIRILGITAGAYVWGFSLSPTARKYWTSSYRRARCGPGLGLQWSPLQAMSNEDSSPSLSNNQTSLTEEDLPADLVVTLQQASNETRDLVRETLRQLAQLSLKDYEWRAGVFLSNQADRLVEESIARMRGDTPTYVRPMDATESALGPLGRWEKTSVEWLSRVFDEEGRRAQQIVNSNGELVRPIQLVQGANLTDVELGPLGYLEKTVVDFLQSIRDSETARVQTQTLRPKDLDEAVRGPLGQLELAAVNALREIRESERLRMQQTAVRGGDVVRPMDVPGPLGEFERQVAEIVRGEQRRANERKDRIVRPKDASRRGPLGEVELQATSVLDALSKEETTRFRNIQKWLSEKRPMESNRESIWGFLEALVVGILKGPQLLWNVLERVRELLASEPLNATDQQILAEQDNKQKQSQRSDEKGNSDAKDWQR
jgi:hypothetical protein